MRLTAPDYAGSAPWAELLRSPGRQIRVTLISSPIARAAADPAAQTQASAAVTAFSAGLFAALTTPDQATNLVCSPYSVAVALGMAVQGARGTTATQILHTLNAGDAGELARGLNALDRALSERSITLPAHFGELPQRIELASASGLFGQLGTAWRQPFLQVLAADFGTGMRAVDYRAAPEAAREEINSWVGAQTHSRIPELVPPGAVTPDTRLTLANALYLKAPWAQPFWPDATQEAPFHRLDGSTVPAQLMSATGRFRIAQGPGWVAADLPYAGQQLAMAVVVPDRGRFAQVRRALTGPWLTGLLLGLEPARVRVGLPRWTTRTQAALTEMLTRLGMPMAFTAAADFSGMTTQEPLLISAVVHEGFIAVDEAGTEAAAATAVLFAAAGGFSEPPRQVIADRPFLYVIHDVPTRTPLFIGQVLDPAAT